MVEEVGFPYLERQKLGEFQRIYCRLGQHNKVDIEVAIWTIAHSILVSKSLIFLQRGSGPDT